MYHRDLKGYFQNYPNHSWNVPGFTRTFLVAPNISLNNFLKFSGLYNLYLSFENNVWHTLARGNLG